MEYTNGYRFEYKNCKYFEYYNVSIGLKKKTPLVISSIFICIFFLMLRVFQLQKVGFIFVYEESNLKMHFLVNGILY